MFFSKEDSEKKCLVILFFWLIKNLTTIQISQRGLTTRFMKLKSLLDFCSSCLAARNDLSIMSDVSVKYSSSVVSFFRIRTY